MAMHQSVYNLGEGNIPKNFATLSRAFLSSHIALSCSRFGYGNGSWDVAYEIFHRSITASSDAFGG